MTGDQWFEVRARAFRQMRGMSAPSTEDPAVPERQDYDSRKAAWLAWNGVHSNILMAIRDAMEEQEKR
jgi:hypothetical protein